uniref:Uncharacterized protein n=1 Tax=Musa acuminata subsp. malaccensis TaxID=214687 RepID=A0A804HVC3_MUSAM
MVTPTTLWKLFNWARPNARLLCNVSLLCNVCLKVNPALSQAMR